MTTPADDPRIAVLSAMSSPDWHPVPEAYGMPWDEAEALLAAYDASRTTGPRPAADIEAEHRTETALHRATGRIAQLEAQLRAAHADLNRVLADAGNGPFGDGIRYTADRIRPHLQTPTDTRKERRQP